VVFSTSNATKSTLIDYIGTETGHLDQYSPRVPHEKRVTGHGIATFLLHLAQCIGYTQTNELSCTLVAERNLRSYYQRYGFKPIPDFYTSKRFKDARSRFHYDDKTDQELLKGYECVRTIPRYVLQLYDSRIVGDIHNLFSILNKPFNDPSFFPASFIEKAVQDLLSQNRKLMEEQGEAEVKVYMQFVDLSDIDKDIDRYLFNRNYLGFFLDLYVDWSNDYSETTISQQKNPFKLLRFEKLALQQLHFYYDTRSHHTCFVCKNCNRTFKIGVGFSKDAVFVIMHLLRLHIGVRKFKGDNTFDLHLKDVNPTINTPCEGIAKSQTLYEQYRVAIDLDEYDHQILNDSITKRLFVVQCFLERFLHHILSLYMEDKRIVTDGIKTQHLKEIEAHKKSKKKTGNEKSMSTNDEKRKTRNSNCHKRKRLHGMIQRRWSNHGIENVDSIH
jgi:hypothetical protein